MAVKKDVDEYPTMVWIQPWSWDQTFSEDRTDERDVAYIRADILYDLHKRMCTGDIDDKANEDDTELHRQEALGVEEGGEEETRI